MSWSRCTEVSRRATTSSPSSNQRSAPATQVSRSRSSRAGSSTTRSSFLSNSTASRVTRSFAVVTDSTADLPDEWRDRYDIEVVPLKVIFGKETFRDRVDMTDEEFFRRLAVSNTLPTTSAPSPGEFAEVYRRLSKDHEGCISIHIGAKLSATAESARIGAASVEGFEVNVIDSQTVSMPIAFLCRIAAESGTLEQAVEYVGVMHAEAKEEAERIAADLQKEFPDQQQIPLGQIGSVLGTHAGPKALGIVYIKK